MALNWGLSAAAPGQSSSSEAISPSATQTARGVVFHDANGNARRDADEPGLAGVRVSNGRQIVRTDAEGGYSLPIDDDAIVFVLKPRGWMTPVNDHQLPQFYYIHKPAGSPPSRFPGVPPTGPLPESIDFPLHKQDEPDTFKALLFGDTQPRNVREVEYIAHDVIEQIVREHGHDASLGVTLGDIAFDNLETFTPLNQAIALIGIPWYNVIGNHDMNYEAAHDAHSDETFERVYGPSYYAFDHGPVHFLVLDDVTWVGGQVGDRGSYHGGLGEAQMEFIRNDLAEVPQDQLIVLMMHIPLVQVEDRQELYRLIEQRPFTLSVSAHTHYMEHRWIDHEGGWQGPEPHHHVINVTVCGSWWRGFPDETGIPHATMSDGGPNGYSIITFDGHDYDLQFRAARRPAHHQMNVYAPERVATKQAAETEVLVNVFAGSKDWTVEMRVGDDSDWLAMQQMAATDPAFEQMTRDETALSQRLPEHKSGAALANLPWISLPKPHVTPHLWRGNLPADLPPGTHLIQIRARDAAGNVHHGQRTIRVDRLELGGAALHR